MLSIWGCARAGVQYAVHLSPKSFTSSTTLFPESLVLFLLSMELVFSRPMKPRRTPLGVNSEFPNMEDKMVSYLIEFYGPLRLPELRKKITPPKISTFLKHLSLVLCFSLSVIFPRTASSTFMTASRISVKMSQNSVFLSWSSRKPPTHVAGSLLDVPFRVTSVHLDLRSCALHGPNRAALCISL